MVKESLPKDVSYICFRLDRISFVPVTLTLILGNIHMPALNALCAVSMALFPKLWIDEPVLLLVTRASSLSCIANK